MADVLVLEDDPDHRLLVTTWLEKMGHTVIGCASAIDAFVMLAGRGSRTWPSSTSSCPVSTASSS